MDKDNEITLHPLLQSSANPQKISLTIKGLAGAALTILIMIGVVPADSANEVNPFIDTVITAIEVTMGAISAWAVVYGGVRKLYRQYFKRV